MKCDEKWLFGGEVGTWKSPVNLSINESLKINKLFYTFETLRISIRMGLSNIVSLS